MIDYITAMVTYLIYFWKPTLFAIVVISGCCYAALYLYGWYRGEEDIDVNHYRRMK